MKNIKMTLEEYISEKTGLKIKILNEEEIKNKELKGNEIKNSDLTDSNFKGLEIKNNEFKHTIKYEEFILDDKIYYVENIFNINNEDITGYGYIISIQKEKDIVKELIENLFPEDKVFYYGQFICIISKKAQNNKGIILKNVIETEIFQSARIIYLGNTNKIYDFETKIKLIEKHLLDNIDFRNSEVENINEILLQNILSSSDHLIKKQFIDMIFGSVDISNIDKEIITTAIGFIQNDLNVSKASRKLYIHRNTLLYRIDKIKQLVDLDIKKFEDAQLFYIGIKLLRYL